MINPITPESAAKPLRVLLVDDHPLTRHGIRSLIKETYSNVEPYEVGSATEALEQIAAGGYHLVFLDLKIPEQSSGESSPDVGKRTLQRIRELDGPPVIIVSAEMSTQLSDRGLVEELTELGAASFVPKGGAEELTLQALRRAVSGGVWMPSDMIGKGGNSPPPSRESLRAPLPKPLTHADLDITPRQFEILRLALNGHLPVRIADILGINRDNVRQHLCRIYEKFNVANQITLLAHFAKTGQVFGVLESLPPRTWQPGSDH